MMTMTRTRVAEALFVSDLPSSQDPPAELIRTAVDWAIRRYGTDGCAARMAAEFGDHPELAIRRMVWVRRTMRNAGL